LGRTDSLDARPVIASAFCKISPSRLPAGSMIHDNCLRRPNRG
jgi:hypothetical protein